MTTKCPACAGTGRPSVLAPLACWDQFVCRACGGTGNRNQPQEET